MADRYFAQRFATGSFGSSGGLRLAGWTAAKRSASAGRKSSDARSIRIPVSSPGRVVCDAEMRAVASKSAGTVTRCNHDWGSDARWRGATVGRLLGALRPYRRWLHLRSAAVQKLVDFPDGVRRSLRSSRRLSPSARGLRRGPTFRWISDKCLIFAGSKNREGVRFYEPNPLICLEFLAPRPGLEPGTYGLTVSINQIFWDAMGRPGTK